MLRLQPDTAADSKGTCTLQRLLKISLAQQLRRESHLLLCCAYFKVVFQVSNRLAISGYIMCINYTFALPCKSIGNLCDKYKENL